MSINDHIFEKPSCKLKFLQREGFHTPNFYEFTTVEEVLNLYREYMVSKRDSLNYDIDGLVQEVDCFDAQEALGWNPSGLNPKFATAIKFDSIGSTTTLLGVRWTVGTTGRVIPTGLFEPVDIMGTTVQKASLHNFEMIDNFIKNGLKIGSEVVIVRSGDVIPKMIAVKSTGDDCTDIEIVEDCPECGTKLNRFSADLVCENMSCPAKTKGIFSNLFNTLDIKGVSDSFIVKVTEKYEITTIAELMQLTVDDFEQLPGFAKKSAQKAYDAIHSVKEVSPEQFFALLNIPNQGVRVFENLFSQFPMESLLDENFKPEDVFDVKGIAEKSAIAIHEGIQANLERLRENAEWFTIKKKEEKAVDTTEHSSKMVGKSFCITGALVHGKRKDYETKIKAAGGKVGSVSKTLDYLVTNDTDTTSSKMKKALDLNAKNHNAGVDKKIIIINEDDLIKLMEK